MNSYQNEHHVSNNPSETEASSLEMRIYSSSETFQKGSYIELSTGMLRRVEDMRTEDFIQSAARSSIHELAESTVVKINTTPTFNVLITFNCVKNRFTTQLEVPANHPFFVYGQGWASCNPEMSLKFFGLKCERLQVGDICISIKNDTSNLPENESLDEAASNLKTTNDLNIAIIKHHLDVTNDPAIRYAALLNLTSNLFPMYLP